MDLSAFLDEFRAEASDYLRALDAQLLALEREPAAAEPIREMFIAAHTIKGGASMLGLAGVRELAHAGVRELAHALEDVLAQLRDQLRPLDAPTADLLFRAID